MLEHVILVDDDDVPQGEMEKMDAHRAGALHRAFSVFIFNSRDELLLQKRAKEKYHCSGLWTNSCCSHPQVGEYTRDAAKRRLMEEMGMACDLQHQFSFKYKAAFENGLIEHEIDHVFFGYTDELPKINLQEVEDFKYVTLENLLLDVKINPLSYTPWLKICLERVIDLKTGAK